MLLSVRAFFEGDSYFLTEDDGGGELFFLDVSSNLVITCLRERLRSALRSLKKQSWHRMVVTSLLNMRRGP